MPTLHEDKIREDAETRRQPQWPPPDWYVTDSAQDEEGLFVGANARDERKAPPAPPHREIRY